MICQKGNIEAFQITRQGGAYIEEKAKQKNKFFDAPKP